MAYELTQIERLDIRYAVRLSLAGHSADPITVSAEASADDVRHAAEMISGYYVDSVCVHDDDGRISYDVWGWDDDTPDDEMEWRITVRLEDYDGTTK